MAQQRVAGLTRSSAGSCAGKAGGGQPARTPAPRRRDDGDRFGDARPALEASLGSGGAALEPRTAEAMSLRFGHDFSRVRVHADAPAARAAEALGARAFTTGHDIGFQRGAYRPGTREGD